MSGATILLKDLENLLFMAGSSLSAFVAILLLLLLLYFKRWRIVLKLKLVATATFFIVFRIHSFNFI
jgi:hypothetical protein